MAEKLCLRQHGTYARAADGLTALQNTGGSLDTHFASELRLQAAALPPQPALDAGATSLRGTSSLELLIPSESSS